MLKENGKSRQSKNSKKNNIEKRKLKKVKCPNCKELVEYSESSIIRMKGVNFIECDFCGNEIIIK